MSKLEVDAIEPQSGTTITIGSSGDTVNLVGTLNSNGSPLPGDISSVVAGTGLSGGGTTGAVTLNIEAAQPTITSLGTITGFTSTGIDDNADATAVTIDSSENVGIKNTTMASFSNLPATDLVVGAGSTDSGITIYSGTSSGSNIGFADATSGDGRNQGIIQYHHNGDYMRFFTSASEKMRISSAGNVGIGTTSPVSLGSNITTLEITGGSTIRTGAVYLSSSDKNIKGYFYGTNTGFNIGSETNADLKFVTNNSERMRIDSSGRAMMGTTTASGILSLNNTGQTSETLLQTEDTGGSGAHSHITLKNTTGTVASLLTSSDNLEFRVDDATVFANISGTEYMRIDNGGNVGIGTDSPSGKLNVVHSAVCANLVMSASSGSTALRLQRTNSDGEAIFFVRGSTGVGNISLTSSSTAYNTSSDYRLKENVSYDFDATTRIKQLKPARFNFIADADTTVDGFLAHEVSSVVPEAIHGTKDAVDEDGNPQYQGIDQAKLVPLLVKTIQELEARITTLENA